MAAPVKVIKADGSIEWKKASAFIGEKKARRRKRWRQVREEALAKADYRCACCGDKQKLHAHHLTYVRRGKERLEDLLILCERCHSTEHAWLRRGVVARGDEASGK